VSHDEPGVAIDPDRHGRRASQGSWKLNPSRLALRVIWPAWFVTMFVAGVIYTQKASEDRSAFIRWRHQVVELGQGKNIWNSYFFPNPPIVPILMSPLVALPPLAGALGWFLLKVVLVTIAMRLCFRMAEGEGAKFTWWAQGLVILLSLRPILSDLQHGNNNIIILFLVVCTLSAWRKGHDILAGLALGLAITYKVTPALLLPYFIYKGSWRTGAATLLGIAVFMLVVPSIVLGPSFNLECLSAWWRHILSPFLVRDVIGQQEVNQSMVAVLTRLITDSPPPDIHKYNGVLFKLNFLELSMKQASMIAKGLSIAMVAGLAVLCRTKTKRRDDPRLLGEFALVVLTMLFVSERSWKHHFVTLLLPYTYLVYRAFIAPVTPRVRAALAGTLAVSALLMLTTSSEVGGWFAGDKGHKIAQFYGMFFWSAFVLYVATAWCVTAARFGDGTGTSEDDTPPEPPTTSVPVPHITSKPQSVTHFGS
jgi:hypothetical protein